MFNILVSLDTNKQSELFAVILNMVDWSQAFDRMNHKLGIQSFIDNGVRPSLIPTLLSFFQDRSMVVKWKGCFSSSRQLPGGGPQGWTLGVYFSIKWQHRLLRRKGKVQIYRWPVCPRDYQSRTPRNLLIQCKATCSLRHCYKKIHPLRSPPVPSLPWWDFQVDQEQGNETELWEK